MALAIPSEPVRGIPAAVKFLHHVSEKGYGDADLRKYLQTKCELTSAEVEEAFRIHREGNNLTSSLEIKEMKLELDENIPSDPLFFMKPDMRNNGETLIEKFLDAEKMFCTALEWFSEYYRELGRMADHGRLQMKRKEVDLIFNRVPGFLKFHRSFYNELENESNWRNIGKSFVQRMDVLRGHVEYIKDCRTGLRKIREYMRDKRLQRCLAQVKARSSRPKYELGDLLLLPLERVTAYRDFVSKLWDWTNEQETCYVYFGKASRRISRLAKYIEERKQQLSDMNEMNKIQAVLQMQYDIFAPGRRPVRQGMMICQKAGRASRGDSHFIFYLFNDILLWTNRKKVLANVLFLKNCRVLEMDAKNVHKEKRFKLEYEGKDRQVFILECASQRKKDEWFKAIESAISAYTDTMEEAWSKAERRSFSGSVKAEIDINAVEAKQQENGPSGLAGVQRNSSSYKLSELEDNLEQISIEGNLFFEQLKKPKVKDPVLYNKSILRSSPSVSDHAKNGLVVERGRRGGSKSSNSDLSLRHHVEDSMDSSSMYVLHSAKPRKSNIVRSSPMSSTRDAERSITPTFRLDAFDVV